MAKTATYTVETNVGCGMVGVLFQKAGVFKLRKAASTPPLSSYKKPNGGRKNDSRKKEELASLESTKTVEPERKLNGTRITSVSPRLPSSHDQIQGKRNSDSTRNSSSSSEKERNNASKAKTLTNCNDHQHGKRNSDDSRNSSFSSSEKDRNKASQLVTFDYTRKLRKEPAFTSSELSLTIAPHRTSDASEAIYRGSSGNIMLLGHLGNLKKQANTNQLNNKSPRIIVQKKETSNGSKTPPLTMGNIVKNPSERNQQFSNLYCSMVNNLNPDMLKSMGNEKYRQGRLEEAIAFYNQAIAIDFEK
ncbi:hypothetical protein Leryth_014043 [Lithospermum erythrorhizon]|nr:hypothetical protein Leryth_014043 [Lithospermum erythrorhizon]